ncbi:MAG TPA: hypothetical protein VH913_03030 [Hyphomicrobiaceae bacterium]|jgi:hypothetical protein
MPSGRLPLSLVALAALAALAGAPTQARAAPLDAETCAKLQGEQERLENAGVEKDMAKGPAWAKANLAPEKLNLVQRFIEIEEQLLFRCRNKVIVNLPAETEAPATGDQAEQDKDDDDKDAATKAPTSRAAKAAAPKPKVPTPKKAAAAPAAKPPPAKKLEAGGARKPPSKAAARPTLSSEPGVTAVEKRPARAKADDAYKPPPPDPNVNPFADQLKLPAKAAD